MEGDEAPAAKTKGKMQTKIKGGKTNAQKIQTLLDQRKPPTEKLPSLCNQYDDDLNNILDSDIWIWPSNHIFLTFKYKY